MNGAEPDEDKYIPHLVWNLKRYGERKVFILRRATYTQYIHYMCTYV